ncbi:hypothetical protein WI372_08140 [Gemmatimonadota bacterium DH-20]|uniref:Lipocalin-like domain-containing protein n=1 Tax=Gaopeijia maritima TaxID=3119007 RepID=A0ABU9E891_9BACT
MRHRTVSRLAAVALVGLFAVACDDSPTEPTGLPLAEVIGSYGLTSLTFDPQGSLPEANVRTTLGANNVRLILAENRTAQVVYQDPVSGLFTTITASFQTTETGVRISFNSGSPYRQLLLSRQMEFVLSNGTLTFGDESPDGVSRDRLIELVPAFEGEQLLDPTPGTLRVTFTLETAA